MIKRDFCACHERKKHLYVILKPHLGSHLGSSAELSLMAGGEGRGEGGGGG